MGKCTPELIVMLTHNDRTVPDAGRIFEECRNAPANFWGFKEDGLPFEQMKALFSYMSECRKRTVLEVVAYTEQECLTGAEMAAECGCDFLMGTLFYDSVNRLCQKHRLNYLPFVGTVTGRPSILGGTAEELLSEARAYLAKGVFGLDLLGYRHVEDGAGLIRDFTAQVSAPVCVAGSVNSYERLDELRAASPWAFTIGGAFFEHQFGGSFGEQIEKVCAYMRQPADAALRAQTEAL